MQFAAEFGEAMAIFRDDFLGGTIEALVQKIEVLIERLQFRLRRMLGEFRGQQLEALTELGLAGGDKFRGRSRGLGTLIGGKVAQREIGLVADGRDDGPPGDALP